MGGQFHAPAASTCGKDLVPILQEAGWAPGSVWTGGKSRPHQDSIPDRPARSSVAIPTELPDPYIRSNLRRVCKRVKRDFDFVTFVRPSEWNNAVANKMIFMEFDI